MFSEADFQYAPDFYKDYWTVGLYEFKNIQNSYTVEGVQLGNVEALVLTCKLRQLRGVLLQAHLSDKVLPMLEDEQTYEQVNGYANNPNLALDLPFSLLPFEKDGFQSALNFASTCISQTRLIKQKALNNARQNDLTPGNMIFEMITGESPKDSVRMYPSDFAITLQVDNSDDLDRLGQIVKDRFTNEKKLNNQHQERDAGSFCFATLCPEYDGNEGQFPLILFSTPPIKEHEWEHLLNAIYQNGLIRTYKTIWRKHRDNYLKIGKIIRSYFDSDNYQEGVITIDVIEKALSDFQEAISIRAHDELISYVGEEPFDDEKLDAIKETLIRKKQSEEDTNGSYDYFYKAGVSEEDTQEFQEIQQLIEKARENHNQVITQAINSIKQLKDFLDKSTLAYNLGLSNHDIILAILRQTPIKKLPGIVRLLTLDIYTPTLQKIMFEDAENEDIEAFYKDLDRPFQVTPIDQLPTQPNMPYQIVY